MRRRTLFADIIPWGNQHGRWLYCRQCRASGAVQTLDLMSCVNCSLTHIYHPATDLRKTCVWTKWLRMIARYRFRMSDPEKAHLRERILRCQERRRLRAAVVQLPLAQTQGLPQEPMRVIVHGEDDWEEAIHQERLSLLAHQRQKCCHPKVEQHHQDQPNQLLKRGMFMWNMLLLFLLPL